MNRDLVAGSLKQFKGALMEQWGKLTRNESGVDDGRREQLVGSIQVRHGVSQQESERQVSDFLRRNRDWALLQRSFRQ